MRFDARELKPYAEPVTSTQLKIGSAYFSVQFLDSEMLLPIVETLIFVGRTASIEGESLLVFEKAGASPKAATPDSGDLGEANEYHQPENQIKHIFEFDKALDQLLACSLRRAKNAG